MRCALLALGVIWSAGGLGAQDRPLPSPAEREALRARWKAEVDRELEVTFRQLRDRLHRGIDAALGPPAAMEGAAPDRFDFPTASPERLPSVFDQLAWRADALEAAAAQPQDQPAESWITFEDPRLAVTTTPVSSEFRRLHGLAEPVGHRVVRLEEDAPLLAGTDPVRVGDVLLFGRLLERTERGEVWRLHRISSRLGTRVVSTCQLPPRNPGTLPRTASGRRALIDDLLRKHIPRPGSAPLVIPSDPPPGSPER